MDEDDDPTDTLASALEASTEEDSGTEVLKSWLVVSSRDGEARVVEKLGIWLD